MALSHMHVHMHNTYDSKQAQVVARGSYDVPSLARTRLCGVHDGFRLLLFSARVSRMGVSDHESARCSLARLAIACGSLCVHCLSRCAFIVSLDVRSIFLSMCIVCIRVIYHS